MNRKFVRGFRWALSAKGCLREVCPGPTGVCPVGERAGGGGPSDTLEARRPPLKSRPSGR